MEISSELDRPKRQITVVLSESEHRALFNLLYYYALKREKAGLESVLDSETGITGTEADTLLQKLETDL